MVEINEDEYENQKCIKNTTENFFRLMEIEDSPRMAAWRYGYLSYKPFSIQIRECQSDGTLMREHCNACGHVLLICKKYSGQCASKKCLDDRVEMAKHHLEELETTSNAKKLD